MGTDIHLAVEVQDKNGQWHLIERWQTCENCYGQGTKEKEGCWWCEGTGRRQRPFYSGRNYNLFAILAGVRNGYGFAGCDTGDGFKPLAEPRGLPTDMDPCTGEWLSHEHTASWLLLSEILATDDYWNQTTKLRGWVSRAEFKAMKDGRPQSWSGGVSGHSVGHITPSAMARYLEVGFPDPSKEYYCQVEWEITYKECCAHFFSTTVEELQSICHWRDYHRLRVVFDFDS